MTDEQLADFESFVDHDEQKVITWFEKNLPNYMDAPDFQSLKASAPADVSAIVLLSEYGSLKWLPATPFLSIISKGETRYSFDQLLSINQHLTIGSNKTRWRHHSLLTTPPRDTGKATLAVTPMSLHHSNPYKRIPENLSAATASPPFSS
jgi:hypothetical protein